MHRLLIYCAEDITPRLTYVFDWIFIEQFSFEYEIINDKKRWMAYQGPKINYSEEQLGKMVLQIIPSSLLFQKEIRPLQQLAMQRWKKNTVIFYNQPGAEVPFDIFSAIFFLISRYEEYLPHTKDKHQRYDPRQSTAYIYSFLSVPLIDEWLMCFRKILEEQFLIAVKKRTSGMLLSFDIDMAWKYLYKKSKQYYGGLLKDMLKADFRQVRERKAVVQGKRPDPYYSFPLLDQLHKKYSIHPLYFILLGKLSAYDRNADPSHPEMQALIKALTSQYDCGIHPSYESNKNSELLKGEISVLFSVTNRTVTKSRQHFIKFSLPHTYRNLIKNGIKEDYSMGYPSLNGFRASTSRSFLWYDLEAEAETGLRIHPFAFMDATSKFYLKQTMEEALKEWEKLYRSIMRVNGTFVSIWHNFILTDKNDPGSWMPVYERVLKRYFAIN